MKYFNLIVLAFTIFYFRKSIVTLINTSRSIHSKIMATIFVLLIICTYLSSVDSKPSHKSMNNSFWKIPPSRRRDPFFYSSHFHAQRKTGTPSMLPGMFHTRRNISEKSKQFVASKQNWKCAECKNDLSHVYEIDFNIPLFGGGSHSLENLQALCQTCKAEKTLRIFTHY